MNRRNINIPKCSDWSISFILPDTIAGIDHSTLNPLFIIKDTNSQSGTLLLNATNIEKIENNITITIPFSESKTIQQKKGYYNFIMFNLEHEFRMCEGEVVFLETLRS